MCYYHDESVSGFGIYYPIFQLEVGIVVKHLWLELGFHRCYIIHILLLYVELVVPSITEEGRGLNEMSRILAHMTSVYYNPFLRLCQIRIPLLFDYIVCYLSSKLLFDIVFLVIIWILKLLRHLFHLLVLYIGSKQKSSIF